MTKNNNPSNIYKRPLTYWRTFVRHFIKILEHKNFLWFVICLFILQSAWVAFSIRYPLIFDEMYHFGVIELFAKQLSPFITNQPESYDRYGTLLFGSASIYHYVLSFPYRIISNIFFTLPAQVVALRLINIALVAAGLVFYDRLLRCIKIKQIYINLSLLFFIFIPIVTYLSATTSYDNLLFPLTALYLLFGTRILMKEPSATNLYLFVISGLCAALVKFTFLPLLIAGILFVFVFLLKRQGTGMLLIFKKSFYNTPIITKVIVVGVFIFVSVLFSIRYLFPIAIYGTPIPNCETVLSEQRCLSNNVYKYENDALSSKNERTVEPIHQYALTWIKTIVMQLDTSAAFTRNGLEVGRTMPIFSTLMGVGVLAGLFSLVYSWRSLKKNIGWIFLISMAITLTLFVFIFNASSYYLTHLDINTQVRYLITIMPIILTMSLVSVNKIIGHNREVKVVLLLALLILMSQGGGVIKIIINANEDWYWSSERLKIVNKEIKDIVSPYVAE